MTTHAAHAVEALAADEGLNVPAAHDVQFMAPLVLYVPGGHGVLLPATHAYPAVHSTGVGVTLPDEHSKPLAHTPVQADDTSPGVEP